jgi:hypothetical protein
MTVVTCSCGLCQGAGIIPGVDEVILRTIVIHVHGCRFGVDADELPKLLPLLDKITAAVRAAQSERQPR